MFVSSILSSHAVQQYDNQEGDQLFKAFGNKKNMQQSATRKLGKDHANEKIPTLGIDAANLPVNDCPSRFLLWGL